MKCKKKYDKKYYIKNKKRILLRCKKNYIKNKERILKKCKEYYEKNKKIINKRKRNYQKLYCLRNKEKVLKWAKKARMKRKDKFNKYIRDRLKKDINFKLRKTIRARIRVALKNDKKRSKTLKLLGVDNITVAKKHLEKSFKPGMTRENHGKWHIDHIIPCSSFDLTKPEEQAKCFHYTNLQPLWASENLSKGNRIS